MVAGQTTLDELFSIVRADPPVVEAAVTRLVDLALVWEAPGGLRPLSGVAEGIGGFGSGLRPRSSEPPPPELMERRLSELSPQARALLEHVEANGGEGTTGRARSTVLPEEAASPVEELLSRRLLVPRGDGLVQLPGEVGIALRGGHTTRERIDLVPELATSHREASMVARAAGGAAFEFVRRVELLLDHWGIAPPTALRSGGLGVRDLKAVAGTLQVDEPTAALLVEVSAAAGLLALGTDDGGNQVWLPTDAFDAWSTRPVAERWVRLASVWLHSPRTPGRVGGRDQAGKPLNALVPELASVLAAETRVAALAELRGLPEGEVLAAGTGVPSLLQRLTWLRPRRPRSRTDLVAWTTTEAAAIGVTGLGGLAPHGAHLLDDDLDAAVAALDPLLPSPVDHVLIQADLTAVAPGPLETDLARRLQLVADVESHGGATVYRFTAGSVRRALDVGWTAAELHDFLGSVSRTPVPQPLSYLVDDTVRTFGTVRVGAAEAFLRADDEAALTELLHHPKAGVLSLRRIAPTVLVSTTPIDVLLPRLRDLGVAPVVEGPDGTVRVARRDLLRARTPRQRGTAGLAAAKETAHLNAVVTAVRAGDRVATARPTAPATPTTPSGALAALREAIELGGAVWIGYVDNHGTTSERVVDPVVVEGGWLTAYDHRSEDTRTFAVHRITAVRPVADR